MTFNRDVNCYRATPRSLQTSKPGPEKGPRLTAAQKIEHYSERIPIAGCWIWIGKADAAGYGKVWDSGKESRAHRVSYREFKGRCRMAYAFATTATLRLALIRITYSLGLMLKTQPT